MTSPHTNVIAGRECPAVTCRRYGPAFSWCDPGTGAWHAADTLPPAIELALPLAERERCARHKLNRGQGPVSP